MGGLTIQPDVAVTEVPADDVALLILPGAVASWHDAAQRPVIGLAQRLIYSEVLVAAICDATIALAEAGLLNSRAHTSNDLGTLEQTCVNYHGSAHYMSCEAVSDHSLITAAGVAPIEFAYEIFKHLGVMREATLEAWLGLYQTRETHYYHELLASLPIRSN